MLPASRPAVPSRLTGVGLPSVPPPSAGAAAPPLKVLTPEARPLEPAPKWALRLLAVAFAAALLSALSSTMEDLFEPIAAVSATVAAIALAAWSEERTYVALRRRGLVQRFAASIALPVAAPIAGIVTGAIATAFLPFVGAAIAPAAAVGGLWFGGAALGSLVILAIDVGVSALVTSFRTRVSLAVLALLGLAGAGSLLVAAAAIEVLDVVRSGKGVSGLTIDVGKGSEKLIDDIAAGRDALGEHPVLLLAFFFLLASVLGLPAVLSTTRKLADAVMERIYPLAAGFDAVGRGERSIRLEEAGSRDFIEVSRSFNRMVDTLGLAERMERAFGLYVSGKVLERIRAQHGDATFPPEVREATVFFADIRGFTSMSERLQPDQVASILNRYFDRVIAVIDEHDGYLNKFIGDAVVVVFNGPLDQPDHAERAARCAIALEEAVAGMNERGAFPEIGQLKVGVGVSTGPMVTCNIGSSRQMEYTVIGDSVNLAARFTSQAAGGEVLVSERTAELLPPALFREPLEPIKVKGKERPVVPYRVWPRPVDP